MTAEIKPGITRELYNANEGYRASCMKHAAESAWRYWVECINPDRPIKPPSDEMIRGTLVHELALEDRESFAVFDLDKVKNPKEWKAFKLMCEQNGIQSIGKDSGTLNEKDVRNCAASLNGAIDQLGITGDKECGIFFPIGKLRGKALIDILGDDGIIYDVKVTDSITPRDFDYRVRQLAYHFQIAWYLRAVEEATGTKWDHRFITIQPTYPYDWNVHKLHDDLLAVGFRDVARAVVNIEQAVESGDWSHPERELGIVQPPSSFYFDSGEYPGAVKS